MQKPTVSSWAMLIALSLIWGASFLGVSVALTGFDPIWVAAMRIALGALALVGVALASGVVLPDRHTADGRRIWLHAFGFAIFSNAVPFTLLSWAQLQVTSGFAGITMAVVPLFVLPLAHVFIPGEQMSLRKTLGFLLGFAGVIVLVGPAALGGMGDTSENIARLACVAASGCYACGGIITRLAPKGPMMSFSAAGLLLAAVLILPIAYLLGGPPGTGNGTAWAALIYPGLFPTALATILLVQVIKTAGPTFLSLVNYQVPIWAVIFGLVFLSEALPPSFLSALGLILAGLALSQTQRRTPRVNG